MRKHAMLIDTSSPLVERAAPGLAPTAFRIWAFGENPCDDGSVFFTDASAIALLDEQTARARVYSIDFDHMSLTANRPAESGRAAGWHTIDVRDDDNGNPELWAVNVEWCADAKAGLEESPPRWRFFSPAFLTNDEGEITSYVNLALCINPLTHGLPSLAAHTEQGDPSMDKKTLLAALAALTSDASDDEKLAAQSKLAEFLEGLDDEKEEKKAEDPDADDKDEEPRDTEPEEEKKAAPEPEQEEKKAEEPDEAPKREAEVAEKTEAKSAAVAMASDLMRAKQRIEALEIERLLDGRKDLPESVRRWCLSQPASAVRTFLAASPRASAKRETRPVQPAPTTTAAALVGPELEEVNRGMGIRPIETRLPQRLPDGRLVMHTVRPSEWLALKAAKKGS